MTLRTVDSSALLEGTVRRTVLSSGLRILTENLPGVRSAAIGIWVGVGSRDESLPEAGASHYLEHLLFKGTSRRSALDISASLEAVGGDLAHDGRFRLGSNTSARTRRRSRSIRATSAAGIS